jgi:LysR family transcriptional regulator for metE and metH
MNHDHKQELSLNPDAGTSRGAPRLEVRDLRLLVAIAEEGSLTHASERLHVTQPALSRHLKSLETRLSAALFLRTRGRLQMTPAGELLLRHAREVLEHVARVEEEIRDAGRGARHQLRVGTECYTAYHWLPAILGRYATQHPRVDVEMAFDLSRRPMKRLLAGALDIALLSDGWRGKGLSVTRLFADEFVAVVSPGHTWAGRAHVDPEDFAGVRLLLVAPVQHSTVLRKFIEPAGVKPQKAVDVQLVAALTGLVAGNYGVGVLPSWTIAPDLRAGRLVAVRLGRDGLRRVWVAATTKEKFRERWVQDFVQLIALSGPGSGMQPVEKSDSP